MHLGKGLGNEMARVYKKFDEKIAAKYKLRERIIKHSKMLDDAGPERGKYLQKMFFFIREHVTQCRSQHSDNVRNVIKGKCQSPKMLLAAVERS